jgi:hypothetical protein
MRIFHVTSIAWTGYIEFIFNDNELLDKMEIHADLSEGQQTFFLKKMPREVLELNNLKTSNVSITEVKEDISFERFWNKYDDKLNSSKKRAEQKWNKMIVAEQIKAYNYILRYFANIPQGTRKKYAETYLNAELWNN